jgi:hypothetical protein
MIDGELIESCNLYFLDKDLTGELVWLFKLSRVIKIMNILE